MFCDCVHVQVLDFYFWHMECDVESNFIFLTCMWFQNVVKTAHAQNRNASTLLKLPEVFCEAVQMRHHEGMFSAVLVVLCMQADGQSSSGCSAGCKYM